VDEPHAEGSGADKRRRRQVHAVTRDLRARKHGQCTAFKQLDSLLISHRSSTFECQTRSSRLSRSSRLRTKQTEAAAAVCTNEESIEAIEEAEVCAAVDEGAEEEAVEEREHREPMAAPRTITTAHGVSKYVNTVVWLGTFTAMRHALPTQTC